MIEKALLQDRERTRVMLRGILEACGGNGVVLSVACAYASAAGVSLLLESFGRLPGWPNVRKRWLIGMDYGRTEPSAFEMLASQGHSEVRVPDGRFVCRARRFQPRSVFHPKVWLVRSEGRGGPMAIVLGSANLSASGLTEGTEVGWLARRAGAVQPADSRFLRQHRRAEAWFGGLWDAATPLADILEPYSRKWRQTGHVHEEAPAEAVPRTSTLIAARHLWVETGVLYKNRGPGQSGNQLDLPRGFRVFFGFSAAQVPRNTVFGELRLRCVGFSPTLRTMRFGNNQMDKLNLPLPGRDGPASYDKRVLLFSSEGRRRRGVRQYRLLVGARRTIKSSLRGAAPIYEGAMQGGRRFGLLKGIAEE